MFKIDMHLHTTLGGDSDIKPEEVVEYARRAGLDAICITEHHDYYLGEVFDRISEKEKFPIFRGMEYSAYEGHLLVYGAGLGKSDFIQGIPMQRVIDWVNERGGIAIPAHPYKSGIAGRPLGSRIFDLTGIIAVEIINGSNSDDENDLASYAARKMGLKGIGGSDAHGILKLGSAFTCFSRQIKDHSDFIDALRNDTYYPSRHNKIR